jgi:RNA polymerase sigma-70 factor (ECF subfamily)
MKGAAIPLRRVRETPMQLSDEALLAGCALGDRAALGALFERHHRAVHRFLARLGRDADDLLQATFLEVRRSASRFDGRAAVLTWILGVASNVARHHGRGEARRRAMLAGVAAFPEPPGPARPDQAAERRQLVALMGRAIAELPHDLRVAFVMCDLEEVPGVEAARVLGLREGTLWRRLHDARVRLRRALEERP